MATKLNKRTVVIVGGGLTAALVARQLTAKGTDVLVLERGTDRRDAAAAKLPSQRDELRWDIRGGLGQDWSVETYTIRHNPKDESFPDPPARRVPARRRLGRRGKPLERFRLAVVGIRSDPAHPPRDALRQAGDPRRHADRGLGRHLCRNGALSPPVREALRPLRQGRKHQGRARARRQPVRSAAARRLSAAAARAHRGGADLQGRLREARLQALHRAVRQLVRHLHQSRRHAPRRLPVLRPLREIHLRGAGQGDAGDAALSGPVRAAEFRDAAADARAGHRLRQSRPSARPACAISIF